MLPKPMLRQDENRGLSTWNSFNDLQRQMNGLIEAFFDRESLLPQEVQDWAPSAELTENSTELTLSVELPGVEEKDVKIELVGNRLSISGERKTEAAKDDDDRKVHRSERFYGSFQRNLILPSNIDSAKIEAKYDNGMLRVHLPKKPGEKPVSIPVSK
jgi:HSP20 family protein